MTHEEIAALAEEFATCMMYAGELAALGNLIAATHWEPGDLLVEIGAYWGETTVFMSKVLRSVSEHGLIVSIDAFENVSPDLYNPQGDYRIFRERIARAGIERMCMPVPAFSEVAAPAIASRVKLLFVDGGHAYECCRSDLRLYSPKVVTGGFIFVDDYDVPQYPGVLQAVNEELMSNPQWESLAAGWGYATFRRSGAAPAHQEAV
jgi:cephalosporin hydroxylase